LKKIVRIELAVALYQRGLKCNRNNKDIRVLEQFFLGASVSMLQQLLESLRRDANARRQLADLLAEELDRTDVWKRIAKKLAIEIATEDTLKTLVLESIVSKVAKKDDLNRLEQRMDRLEERLERLEDRVARLEERIGRLEERIDVQTTWLKILIATLWIPMIGILIKLLGLP